ncbi:MAG: STAS domain-containing protein [Pseudomonadota bacterium]
MDITVNQSGGITVVSVAGRLDSNTSRALQEALVPLADKDHPAIVVDCTHLSYVSSAGLRVFLMTAKPIHASGGRFALAAVAPQVRKILSMTGLDTVLDLHESVQDALRAFG